MHAYGLSAVHSNALFELDPLHASDQYDPMLAVCGVSSHRDTVGEERAWERVLREAMHEAMGRVDRK